MTIFADMGWFQRFSPGTLQIALIVLALLVGLRVALPHLVKNYVNKKLDEMPQYDGHISDVNMHPWRGAYSIQGIEIVKTEGEVPVPFFRAKRSNIFRRMEGLDERVVG
jgi:hypothetical protein